MKNNIKFTSDGKKVKVISEINNNEFIVQEIFIEKDNTEKALGEKFVAQLLSDTPAISWKEKRIKEIDIDYKVKLERQDNRIKDLQKKEEIVLKSLKNKIEYLKNLNDKLTEKPFNKIFDFILNKNKYAIIGSFSPKIIDFSIEKDMIDFWDGCNNGYRLISLYGKSNGDLEWRIHQYSDYSGSSDFVKFFKTLEEAKQNFLEMIKDKDYSENLIKEKIKWSIPLNKSKLKQWKKTQIASYKIIIKNKKEEIELYEKKIKEEIEVFYSEEKKL